MTIETNNERFKFIMDCGNIQPGRKIFSDEFFIGIAESGKTNLAGHFYAENLPDPKEFMLTIDANIAKTSMTVNELIKLADAKDDENVDHEDD